MDLQTLLEKRFVRVRCVGAIVSLDKVVPIEAFIHKDPELRTCVIAKFTCPVCKEEHESQVLMEGRDNAYIETSEL